MACLQLCQTIIPSESQKLFKHHYYNHQSQKAIVIILYTTYKNCIEICTDKCQSPVHTSCECDTWYGLTASFSLQILQKWPFVKFVASKFVQHSILREPDWTCLFDLWIFFWQSWYTLHADPNAGQPFREAFMQLAVLKELSCLYYCHKYEVWNSLHREKLYTSFTCTDNIISAEHVSAQIPWETFGYIQT